MKQLTKFKKHVQDHKAAYLTAGVLGVVGYAVGRNTIASRVMDYGYAQYVSGLEDGMAHGVDEALHYIYQARDEGLIDLTRTDKLTDNEVLDDFVHQASL